MAFLGLFGNYDKPGPGVSKDEPPKAAPIRFFEIFGRKFGKLVQLNLIFLIPTIVAAVLMGLIYLCPTHYAISVSGVLTLDVWTVFVVPMPLVLLSPFVAGLTFVTRNFAREEHAFVWSDFWDAVKGNWKYFLLNGLICYAAFLILGFAFLYYFYMAAAEWLYYIPCWFCAILAVIFLFAQYYLPVMFVTFDLKFTHAYKNALIFTLAGFGRNLLVTIILVGLVVVLLALPLVNLTVLVYFLLVIFILFSFVSYLVNFTVYPVVDKYLIQPYLRQQEEKGKEADKPAGEEDEGDEDFSGLFAQLPEEPEDNEEDKYVYYNGKLVKKSQINDKEP